MATFIKTGFWEKRRNPPQGFKGELNLDQFVQTLIPPPTPSTNIYNSDGTLTGNRTIDGNSNNLVFNNINQITLEATNEVQSRVNNTWISINNGSIYTKYNYSDIGFVFDFVNRIYKFGQITGNNATTLKIDDAAAFPVQVSGTNVTQNTSGTASGKFLKIKVDGVDYVIDLKNPS